MAILVRQLTASDFRGWDEYVLAHAQGSPFHTIAWKNSIEETFGYKPLYLVATEDEQIRGVLPLFLVENILLGKALLSTPFAVYGGILADSEAARQALTQYVRTLADFFQVQYVELRNAWPEQCAGFAPAPRYVTFTQEIGPDDQKVLLSIPRKTRAAVRKSLGFGLTSRVTLDPRTFESLYSENLRKLGTPSFPASHFDTLLRNFRGNIDIREVIHEGKVIAAVMSLYFRDQALPYYGASDPAFNALQPNNFMYYDQMREAGRAGYRTFDFGRSKRISGSYDFKCNWGMTERDLPYEILLVKKKEMPNFSPNNKKFQLPIKIWQRLPLPLTRALGPSLVRLVP
ncbi:MAG: FemAB family PEP-CTERM system-associated protein [Acidobacteria bacterium]|nr:FemAB family PEP-CTERM system-associated protein [Acidobacteriota bacterium]